MWYILVTELIELNDIVDLNSLLYTNFNNSESRISGLNTKLIPNKIDVTN